MEIMTPLRGLDDDEINPRILSSLLDYHAVMIPFASHQGRFSTRFVFCEMILLDANAG